MRRVYRKRPIDYILPFLVIVGLGVIGVLGWQIWSTFEKQGKSDVYFYVVEGKAKLLPYGQTNWDNAYSGTKLLLGDSLKSSSLGKVVLAFFNGTLIRMGNDTAVTLTDLNKGSDREKIVVTMDNGMVWLNGRKSPGVKEAEYQVRTTHMLVKATGTVFEVENNNAEVVRVFDGVVAVDVLVKTSGKERVADTIEVGVGQEIVLDEATLKAFEDNQSPSVLIAISDEFKASDWYRWNMQEDANPTSYSAYRDESETVSTLETSSTQEVTQQETMESASSQEVTTQETGSTAEVMTDGLLAPTILKPEEGSRTVSKGPVTISGAVAAGTAKVVVEQVIDGRIDSYTLTKFKAGDAAWSYNVSESLGNLRPGENVYSFYAFDKDGEKSEAAEITITYEKGQVEVTGELTAPVVLTFNGSTSSTVTTGVVKVEGTVQGAEKIVVSGYTLSKFEPGATTWTYFANESGGNLKPGLNEYEVYAVDPDGNKSAVVKFTITYNKPEGSALPAPAPGLSPSGQPDYGF